MSDSDNDQFYSSPDEMERFRNNMDTQTKDFIKDKLEKALGEFIKYENIFTDLEKESLIDSRVNYADKYKIVYDHKNKIHSTFETKQDNTAVQEIEVLVDLYYRKAYYMRSNGWKWWEKETRSLRNSTRATLGKVHEKIPEGFAGSFYWVGGLDRSPDEVLRFAQRQLEEQRVAAMPEGWYAYTDAAGREYFHNMITGVTQWEPPAALPRLLAQRRASGGGARVAVTAPVGGRRGKRRRKKRTKKKSRRKKKKTLKNKRKRRKRRKTRKKKKVT